MSEKQSPEVKIGESISGQPMIDNLVEQVIPFFKRAIAAAYDKGFLNGYDAGWKDRLDIQT